MNRLALCLLLIAGLASSCKTTTEELITPAVDPRDRMVGTYDIGYSVVIRFGSKATTPETYTGTLAVTKSTSPNELFLDFDAPGMKEKLRASLVDSTFTVLDKKTQPIILNGTSFTGQFSATGMFVREGGQQKVTYTGVSEDVDLKLVTSLTGTKK
ncbi:hypothetical protein [Fibrivirga algicola]|uniref:Lipocalin-like domain-containing protein n=1 Tax=Fibrivirga algicola TaxID=2950420 RepID=A0ABX0QJM0_9BACT|nr:hypothetical protein [Fibrivirga algicola]ARK12396.1 hypothetical protein A6C57_19790 [Fibrella sp. ES10-3-2-2]NID12469.1 hypothetical protein [Fibrivirga algicola]